MAMPVPSIIFTTTQAGRDAAAFAFNNLPNGKLSLQTIKVGSGKYIPTGHETALQTPYANTFNIGGGGVQEASGQIRFTPILLMSTRLEVFEIGLYSDTGILFAVAATPSNTPLLVLEADIEAIFSMNIAFGDVDANSIQIIVDVNAPLAIVMMGQHVVAAHPHSQYKRTLDNSERLKVAAGVDNDDAVNKGQLEAEATTRAGVDSALAGQIAQEVLDRQAGDSSLSQAINSEATTRAGVDSALAGQIAQEVLDRQAGDSSLSQAINSEATTRAGVDSALAGQIAQEVLDRQAGDSALLALINANNSVVRINSNTGGGHISETRTLPNGCRSVFIAANSSGGRAGATPSNGGQGGGAGAGAYLRVCLKGNLSGYVIDFHIEAANGDRSIPGYNTFGSSATDNNESWIKIWNPNISNYSAIFHLGTGQNAGDGHGEHDGGGVSWGGPKGIGGKVTYRIAANPSELYDIYTLDGTDGTDGVFNVGQHDSSLTGHGGVQELGANSSAITNPSSLGSGGTAGSSNTVGYQGGLGFIFIANSPGS